jgi:TPR repeat protein
MASKDVDELDMMEAFNCYKTAADAGPGLPQAQLHLYEMYKNGYGVEKDIEEARFWANRAFAHDTITKDAAFDDNFKELLQEVRDFFVTTSDIDFDRATPKTLCDAASYWIADEEWGAALKYAEIGAMRGNAEAAYLTALGYDEVYTDFDIARDLVDGLRCTPFTMWWMHIASIGGWQEAIEYKKENARLYADNDSIEGYVLTALAEKYRKEEDYIRMFFWYSILSDSFNYKTFAFWVGWCLFYGKGTWKNKKNYKAALNCFQKAAEGEATYQAANSWLPYKGQPNEWYIAQIYLTGGYGVERDLEEAVKWYKKYISLNSKKVTAQDYTNLGHACLKLGNESEALNYYQKAEKF